MHYWNPENGGFYQCQYHGARKQQIIDPDFEWPMVEVPDPSYQGEDEAPMVQVRDDTIEPPLIDVPNPDTKIPPEAVEISEEHYQQLIDGLSKGKRVQADETGRPEIVDPPQKTLNELAEQKRRQINAASVKALSAVRNEYPDYEQLSWERQEREALEGGGPLIDSIAAARGLETSELIDRILEKANLYQQAAGTVIGKRQALEDQIAAALEAGDREAIQALSW